MSLLVAEIGMVLGPSEVRLRFRLWTDLSQDLQRDQDRARSLTGIPLLAVPGAWPWAPGLGA